MALNAKRERLAREAAKAMGVEIESLSFDSGDSMTGYVVVADYPDEAARRGFLAYLGRLSAASDAAMLLHPPEWRQRQARVCIY